ncbi:DUF4258 domain-containing protein [Lamprocystis purpurea]|jgi:hypothetical protein|uniref:DUF4258 domain-containing protein n=1 Tax=Lamprocystis purpurea TaxID=61598 RepID=UPI00038138F4|nr:DUF4258 domain-containing protein [Lamprocystis purpurea]
MKLAFSNHALARVRQRGLRERDVAMVLDAGTLLGEDSVMLLDQDVARAIETRKREIAALERLRGCRVVMGGETVVTVYRPVHKVEKRLLRAERNH